MVFESRSLESDYIVSVETSSVGLVILLEKHQRAPSFLPLSENTGKNSPL